MFIQTMSSLTSTASLLHTHNLIKCHSHHSKHFVPTIKASISPQENVAFRRKIVTTLLVATSLALGQQLSGRGNPPALAAEKWGTRSFIKERFFEPDLSPEESVARIRETAEGLHFMREMLDRMAWRYVLFYIRLKQAYLGKDLKIAMSTLPQGRRKDYVIKANELVENMSQVRR
uniref:Calcium ion binding protein n=1 Tax=Rhizophora mucronata TaxID=61149 RepID=A0A2P2IY02_RHIMU